MEISDIKKQLQSDPLFIRIEEETEVSITVVLKAARLKERERYCEVTVVKYRPLQVYTHYYD